MHVKVSFAYRSTFVKSERRKVKSRSGEKGLLATRQPACDKCGRIEAVIIREEETRRGKEGNVVAIIQAGRRMGFISMYNSQEGVASSDVRVKSFFHRGRKVRGGPDGWWGRRLDQSHGSCARTALPPPSGGGTGTKIRFYLLHIRVRLGNVVPSCSASCHSSARIGGGVRI